MSETTASAPRAPSPRAIRALVVDDDAVFALSLTRLLSALPGISHVSSVASIDAARMALSCGSVDICTIDVRLGQKNGLELLDWLRKNSPKTLSFVVSAHPTPAAQVDAMLRGAAGYTPKSAKDLMALASALKSMLSSNSAMPSAVQPKLEARILPSSNERKVLAVGGSTGAPPVLKDLISALPPSFAFPVLVTQHLPASHATHFVDMLARLSSRRVVLAREGERVENGTVYIAPSEAHLLFVAGSAPRLALDRGPQENHCRPAVDPLFRSLLPVAESVVAVVLSGMGKDGAEGARALHAAGAFVIAQDRESSVVWGMPGAAVACGASDVILPAASIAEEIQNQFPARRCAP